MPADNATKTSQDSGTSEIALRTANLADAQAIWGLVSDSDVLDTNSAYCYLLLCRDFSETCVVACRDDRVVGFVTAYVPPGRSDTVFVWQVGVAAEARRQGLAKRMLLELLSFPACDGVNFMEANVTPSNDASRRLFQSVAENLDTACRIQPGFTADLFGPAGHEPEDLFQIGPIRQVSRS